MNTFHLELKLKEAEDKIAKLEKDNEYLHLRIDRMAKNYKILNNADQFVDKKTLLSKLHIIRKRLFNLENN